MNEILYAAIVSLLCLAINLQSIRIPSILHAANFVLCYLRHNFCTNRTNEEKYSVGNWFIGWKQFASQIVRKMQWKSLFNNCLFTCVYTLSSVHDLIMQYSEQYKRLFCSLFSSFVLAFFSRSKPGFCFARHGQLSLLIFICTFICNKN